MSPRAHEPRRSRLRAALIWLLAPIPLGFLIHWLHEAFKEERHLPAGDRGFSGAYDFVGPLLWTTVAAAVCTLVAIVLTLRSPPSPWRWVLLLMELIVVAGVAFVGHWIFG